MSPHQEGIDAVTAIDEPAKMDSGGVLALNKLRIGSKAATGGKGFPTQSKQDKDNLRQPHLTPLYDGDLAGCFGLACDLFMIEFNR